MVKIGGDGDDSVYHSVDMVLVAVNVNRGVVMYGGDDGSSNYFNGSWMNFVMNIGVMTV